MDNISFCLTFSNENFIFLPVIKTHVISLICDQFHVHDLGMLSKGALTKSIRKKNRCDLEHQNAGNIAGRFSSEINSC